MQQNEERYYSLVRIARAMVLGIQDETDLRTAINCLMNGIFKLPSNKTGLASPAALKLPKNKRTPEHFYGRTASAERLIKELIENPGRSDKAIVAFLKSRSRIHYVTKSENMALRSYNKINPKALWREAYRECGIELVEFTVGRAQKYVYIVDDVEYNTVKEAAVAHDISYEAARNRFFKAKKFPNWIAKEI
jgi:hypothetical protein